MQVEDIQAMIQQLVLSQQETDRLLRENAQQLALQKEEADRKFALQKEEADRMFALQKEEADRQMRELRRTVGEVTRSIGTFAEGLAYPSLERIMADRFGATHIGPNVKAFKNGKTLELDVLGYANGNHNVAIIAEVKTRLRDADVQQLLDTLAAFPVFFPEHKHKRRYGLLIGGSTPESVRNLALSAGLYVGRMTDETFELIVPQGFEGKNFQEAV